MQHSLENAAIPLISFNGTSCLICINLSVCKFMCEYRNENVCICT